MITTFFRPTVAALVCSALLAFAAPAQAEMMNMKAELSASNEVPPVESKASGSVDLTYDTASKRLTWNGTYENLSGPPSMAHFHTGEAGKNGGVAVVIFKGEGAKSPFSGSATLTEEQERNLLDGKLYVNIHTAAHKAGEVRGQVTK